MTRISVSSLVAMLAAVTFMRVAAALDASPINVDLAQWSAPDIGTVENDPFGKLVKCGARLFTDTAVEIGPAASDSKRRFAGNNLSCKNCHLQAGRQPYAMPLVGIWGQFPQYRAREGAVELLQNRINGCMERSMNGRALRPEGREMLAFLPWMRWLSGGIPDGAKLIGAGTLPIKLPDRAADPHHGAQVDAQYCAACHGAEGLGQRTPAGVGYQIPPLWGPDSFNNGAGMARLLTVASYAMYNMPLGTTFNDPLLSDADAYDVAAYIISQERPQMADLDRDFPIRLQKPIDTPYGPYADGFSAAQHTFGPFGPILAKDRELAATAGVARAGGPDNGSNVVPGAQ
jgi:thiosulfate dehydrogenase